MMIRICKKDLLNEQMNNEQFHDMNQSEFNYARKQGVLSGLRVKLLDKYQNFKLNCMIHAVLLFWK